MRKSILTMTCLGLVAFANAQETVITEKDGKVGIGTTTPSEKLEIYDSTTTPGTISLKSIRNDAGFVDVGRISAKQSTTEVSRIGMPRAGGTYTGYLTFWTKDNNNASLTEKMRINEFGNVGIGNTRPVARLHVVNSITGQGDSKVNMSKNSVLTLKPHATNSTNMQFAQVNNGNGMGIQVTNSGNTANWDIALNPYGGNVGIGTTTPNSKLEVYHSSLRTVEVNPQNQLDVTGNSSLTIKEFVPSIEYQDSSNSSADAVTFANNNKFYIGKKTGSRLINSSLFNVDLNTGRVGIGTTNPRSRLDLGSNVGAEKGLRIGDYIEINERETINNAGVIGFNATIDKTDVSKFKPSWAGASNASGMVMTMASGGRSDLNFYGYQWGTNSTPRSLNEFTKVLHLGTDGDVGVGLTEPNGRFEVRGNSAVYSDFAGYTGITNNATSPKNKRATFIISETATGNYLPGTGGQVTYKGGLAFGKGGAGIYSINPNPAGSPYYGELRFHTTSWNSRDRQYFSADRMVIKLNGNVGIGTTTPDAKLAVNGQIHTKEVKVDLVGWPDYVFEETYKLPSLKEVENHIVEKGHLPNIPSAKEVEKAGGIHLGEMNKKLLEKVEELTLYTIEQDKEIQKLKEQNKELLKLAKEIELIKQKLK